MSTPSSVASDDSQQAVALAYRRLGQRRSAGGAKRSRNSCVLLRADDKRRRNSLFGGEDGQLRPQGESAGIGGEGEHHEREVTAIASVHGGEWSSPYKELPLLLYSGRPKLGLAIPSCCRAVRSCQPCTAVGL